MELFQETELKLRLTDPALYDQIASDPFLSGLSIAGSYKESNYDSTYYDTADRRLLTGGLALRVRNTGEGHVATVKDSGTVSGGLYVRGEWNKVLNGEFSIEAFSDLPVGERLAEVIGEETLEPLIQTVFKRVSMELQTDGGCIEFAADKGEIIAGGKSLPLCEVELELKSGAVTSLLQLGASLAERYPLAVEEKSKFERGLILSGYNGAPDVIEASPGAAGSTVRDVMAERMIRALHTVLRMQDQLLQKTDDAEAIHQFRVSVRRLRALLSFAKPSMDSALYLPLTEKLRALANHFSYKRELDVLLGKYRSAREEQAEPALEWPGMESLLNAERQEAQDKLFGTISSYPATSVLLTLWGLVLGDIWTKKADWPFKEFSEKRLKKWTRAFISGLKSDSFKDMRRTHRLRILGKKIRYVQDAFYSGSKDTVPIKMRELKRLQGLLGELCDIDRNVHIIKELIHAHPEAKSEGEWFIGLQKNEMDGLKEQIRKI